MDTAFYLNHLSSFRGTLYATEQLPAEIQTLIIQKAEGNPFFVEEVVKSLQEVSAICRVGAQYVLTKPIEEIVVPDTIQDVLMARIDRLDEAPKQTLQVAAVIGREFTYRLLSRLASIQERTEASLQALKAIELIYEMSLYPELAYMFKHALTQDVAYNSLLNEALRAVAPPHSSPVRHSEPCGLLDFPSCPSHPITPHRPQGEPCPHCAHACLRRCTSAASLCGPRSALAELSGPVPRTPPSPWST